MGLFPSFVTGMHAHLPHAVAAFASSSIVLQFLQPHAPAKHPIAVSHTGLASQAITTGTSSCIWSSTGSFQDKLDQMACLQIDVLVMTGLIVHRQHLLLETDVTALTIAQLDWLYVCMFAARQQMEPFYSLLTWGSE